MRPSPRHGRRPRSEDIPKAPSLHSLHRVLITAPQTIASTGNASTVQIPMNVYATKDGQAPYATKTSMTVPPTLVRTGEHARTTSTLMPALVLPASMETTARTILTNVLLIPVSMDHAQMVWAPSHAPAARAGWVPSVTKLFLIV